MVPFACQLRGQSVRAAVEDDHRRTADKPVIDYAFHLILVDPTEQVLSDERPERATARSSGRVWFSRAKF